MPVRVSEITDEGQNANIHMDAFTTVKAVTASLVGTTKGPEVRHGDITETLPTNGFPG